MQDFDDGIWKIFTTLGDNERAFNQLQHQYRVMASGWILAEFAGVQFVLSHFGQLHLPDSIALIAIGLAGAIGITLLWNLDLRVYHQLLESCFVEGLKLERQHPWLPRLRENMLASQGTQGKGVLARVVWFYVAGVLVSLAIALGGAVSWTANLPGSWWIPTGGLLIVGALIAHAWATHLIEATDSPLLSDWLRDHPPTP